MGVGSSKSRVIPVDEDIRDRYKIGAILGCGTFGQVRECINSTTKESYAVKIIDQNPNNLSWGRNSIARREVELLSSLNHPSIIRFVDVYEDSQFLYVVMERCNGGELFERIVAEKKFKESDVIDFSRQMFSAIEYVHSHHIIHRDIKADNFLLTGDGLKVKLIDFGLAVKVSGSRHILSDVVGSAYYMAPEMLNHKYSFQVDMWSAGVLMFLMIFGRYPFDDETDELIFRKIQRGVAEWNSQESVAVTSEAKDFIQRLLDVNPRARMTAIQALNDPFLRHKSTSEKTDFILIPESVTDRINEKIIVPARSRRKERIKSEAERARSSRILKLEEQFEEGRHRGRRLSGAGMSFSLPTSPLKRQATKGLFGHQNSNSTAESNVSSPRVKEPKRSRSLPGAHVTFDSKPPDVFVYTDGNMALTKVTTTESRKKHGGL
jgi:myosin-light-chain kinase